MFIEFTIKLTIFVKESVKTQSLENTFPKRNLLLGWSKPARSCKNL